MIAVSIYYLDFNLFHYSDIQQNPLNLLSGEPLNVAENLY